ncbi:MAG: ABC transporter permease [Acidobacteria bacterium]|nr:MAG: ABC transporter permease [Acidobacteriota bacterium]
MIIVRLGWRNLWRNSRRSLITIAGIAFAFAFTIAFIGLGRGLVVQLLKNGTELMVGHVQIHDRDYLPDRDLYETIGNQEGCDWKQLIAGLKRRQTVVAVAPRVFGFGLVSTGEQSAGAQMIGVDPTAEGDLSRLVDRDMLARLKPGSVLIGSTLALELGAAEGSEIAAVTQAADGTLGNDLFRVAGIVRTGLSYLDRSVAFMHIDDLQRLLALEPSRIHEIAVKVRDPLTAPDASREISRMNGLPEGVSVQSWRQLLPQLNDYLGLAGGANAFIIGLVVVFVSFGILNTMMMATFERIREIGMLNAFGMRPGLVLLTFLFEAFFLALLGLAIGFGLGALIMRYLSLYGLDLTRWTGQLSMLQTRVDPILNAVWNWKAVVAAGISLWVATIIAAYLPARKAVRVDPVEALRAPVMQ